MTVHKRIRPFNTAKTYPEQKLDNDLSQAVVARGTMVFLRGQIGQNLDTTESVGKATRRRRPRRRWATSRCCSRKPAAGSSTSAGSSST